MTDGAKIAAAILAAEAARQFHAQKAPSGAGLIADQGRDIPGNIMSYYRHFLSLIAADGRPQSD